MDKPQVDPEDTADAGSGGTSGASLSATAHGQSGGSAELTPSRVTFRDEAGLVLGSVEISDFKIGRVATVEVADFAVVTESAQVEVIPTDAPPTQKTVRRLNLKPPTRPLAFPNEPGYRALLYAATQEVSAWETTPDGLTLRTAVAGPDKELLSVVMGGVDEHPNALSAALGLLPHSEDGTALKVLIALPALFFDHNPHAAYNAVHETTIPDLMRYMGFKPKHGAFERDDQERVWRAICLLNRVWIPAVTWHTKRGRGKEVSGQGTWFSPVIVLQGIQQGMQGITLPQAVRYSLGKDFHAYYAGDVGTRTRMLAISPKIMELHGRRDINLLRLAVYYYSQLRINQQGFRHGKQSVDFTYATLLTKAGIPIDKVHPRRQFGRLIAWHDELATKGHIGDYTAPAPPQAGSPFIDYAPLKFWVSPGPAALPRGG